VNFFHLLNGLSTKTRRHALSAQHTRNKHTHILHILAKRTQHTRNKHTHILHILAKRTHTHTHASNDATKAKLSTWCQNCHNSTTAQQHNSSSVRIDEVIFSAKYHLRPWGPNQESLLPPPPPPIKSHGSTHFL